MAPPQYPYSISRFLGVGEFQPTLYETLVRLCKTPGRCDSWLVHAHSTWRAHQQDCIITVYLWLLFDPPRLQGRVGTVILCTFLKPLARLHPVTRLFQLTREEGRHTHRMVCLDRHNLQCDTYVNTMEGTLYVSLGPRPKTNPSADRFQYCVTGFRRVIAT